MPYFSYTQIQVGPVAFNTWGLFLGLAFFISSWLFLRSVQKKGISQKKILGLIFFVFLGSLLGARLGYVLQFPKYYFIHPLEILYVWQGGLTFYGGLLGALIAVWLQGQTLGHLGQEPFAILQKVPVPRSDLNLLDIAVPSLALGIFIGRLGCFLINDHQGAITNLFWAIQWPDGSMRHPVALYLALNALIMLLVFQGLALKRFQSKALKKALKKRPGQLFIIFLIWYCLVRFFLDFTRADDTLLADPQYLGLFISQWIGLAILLVMVLIKTRFLLTKQ